MGCLVRIMVSTLILSLTGFYVYVSTLAGGDEVLCAALFERYTNEVRRKSPIFNFHSEKL